LVEETGGGNAVHRAHELEVGRHGVHRDIRQRATVGKSPQHGHLDGESHKPTLALPARGRVSCARTKLLPVRPDNASRTQYFRQDPSEDRWSGWAFQ
jgi:hypothetical protein